MNARTAQQIENLKNQTIGVEVEMNNITRNRAAKLAAEFFGTGRYQNTAGRNGYSTWSAWDAQGREWKFQKDVSISGCDSEKCEMVTPILHYSDIETLQELVRKLRKAGAISHAGVGAGIHIHIGANGHTPQTLRNLANIMASHEQLIADALKIDQGRISRYCRTVNPRFIEQLNKKKPTTMAQLADIWYESQRQQLRQKPALQRKPLPYDELPRSIHKRHNRVSAFQFRQACQRKEERPSRRSAEKLDSAMPCPFRNGKGGQNGKPQATADGESEIRNENMADSLRIGWGRILDSEGFPHKKPFRQCRMEIWQLRR